MKEGQEEEKQSGRSKEEKITGVGRKRTGGVRRSSNFLTEALAGETNVFSGANSIKRCE